MCYHLDKTNQQELAQYLDILKARRTDELISSLNVRMISFIPLATNNIKNLYTLIELNLSLRSSDRFSLKSILSTWRKLTVRKLNIQDMDLNNTNNGITAFSDDFNTITTSSTQFEFSVPRPTSFDILKPVLLHSPQFQYLTIIGLHWAHLIHSLPNHCLELETASPTSDSGDNDNSYPHAGADPSIISNDGKLRYLVLDGFERMLAYYRIKSEEAQLQESHGPLLHSITTIIANQDYITGPRLLQMVGIKGLQSLTICARVRNRLQQSDIIDFSQLLGAREFSLLSSLEMFRVPFSHEAAEVIVKCKNLQKLTVSGFRNNQSTMDFLAKHI
ncbi:hypothetical protein BDA99DRAFT_531050 [Phascolomyces articulosus]|uniref:Uncharacterized protein n=1 Tax=Phascolomyces articulosus TaxID=60185 RepID=A0AAD5KY47_9FUNG|nr:hypothetical protein BDA99DRAFT_531050 [Phascolomyces articulosus]